MKPSLTTKQKYSKYQADFLDITIYKGQRFLDQGFLDLKVYQKPINLYLYIAFNSDIPEHIKKAFIKTELIRYCRICSDELSFEEVKSFFFARLRDRGYPIPFLTNEFKKVQYSDRYHYLHNNRETQTDCIFYKVMFDSRIGQMNLGKLFRNCNEDSFCISFIEEVLKAAPKICYQIGKSLQNMIVHAKSNKWMFVKFINCWC